MIHGRSLHGVDWAQLEGALLIELFGLAEPGVVDLIRIVLAVAVAELVADLAAVESCPEAESDFALCPKGMLYVEWLEARNSLHGMGIQLGMT